MSPPFCGGYFKLTGNRERERETKTRQTPEQEGKGQRPFWLRGNKLQKRRKENLKEKEKLHVPDNSKEKGARKKEGNTIP